MVNDDNVEMAAVNKARTNRDRGTALRPYKRQKTHMRMIKSTKRTNIPTPLTSHEAI